MLDLINLIFANKVRQSVGALVAVFSVILAPVLYLAHPGPIAVGGVILYALALASGIAALKFAGWRGGLAAALALALFVVAAVVMRQQR